MTLGRRIAYFLAPMLVCMAVYWRAPFVWFRIDDFAWLGLPQYAHDYGILRALFEPMAQGTVRVISERIPFLVFSSLFGLHAWPFRMLSIGTWFATVVLIQLVGARLTGSRAAGLCAAVLWTINSSLILPLSWASAYNQTLCAFVILLAFYARLRWMESGASKWRWTEAIAYFAGFGVLEIIVVYPALVMLHAAVSVDARKRWRSALWMFVPAAAFALAHLYLIPKDPSPIYRMFFDSRTVTNLYPYALWTVGFTRSRVIIGVLGLFFLWRLWRRDFIAIFMLGWFLIVLAPVLPLANHLSEYYVTVPGIGIAWLAGWAMLMAWESGWITRAIAAALVLLYASGSVALINRTMAWQMDVTAHMRVLMRAIESVTNEHEVRSLVLTGISEDLMLAGFRDDPFRLFGIEEVWLAPGQDQIVDRHMQDGFARFRTTVDKLAPRMAQDGVRVLEMTGATVQDVTGSYAAVVRALYADTHRGFIDAGDPFYASALGAGWYPIENNARWIGKSATLEIERAEGANGRLYITGFAAPGGVPVTLRFSADGRELGSGSVSQSGPFTLDFAMPPGPAIARIFVECSRVMRVPGDSRDLGVILRTFAIR